MGRAGCFVVLLVAGCGRIDFDPQPARWEPLGDSATGTGITGAFTARVFAGPRVALAPDGRPVISWTDGENGNDEVRLVAWTGREWAGVGDSALPGGISNDAERSLLGGLAIAADNQMCHAWVADEINTMRLRCWDGSTWRGLAGSETSMTTPGNPWWPALRFIEGQLVVGWEDYGGGNGGFYAKRYDGGSWQWLGPSALPGIAQDGRHVTIAGDAMNDIYVMTTNPDELDMHVTRWNGASWTDANVSNTAATSGSGHIAVGDQPFASWLEGETDAAALYLRAWDGSAWSELDGSATADGIGRGQLPVTHSDLAVTLDGDPIVAYAAGGDIHVRAWDGAAWIAPGDQGAGGISRSGLASWPAIEVTADGTTVVAWYEELPEGGQVYLRTLAARR